MTFSETLQNVQNVHARLQDWKKKLISCLREESSDVPHVLSLHMYYCAIVTIIFGFVEEKAKEHELPQEKYQDALNLRLTSARKTAQLEGTCRASWGIDRAPAGNVQWITVALSTLLKHLDDNDNREAFISLCIASNAISRRWVLGKAMLRSIHNTARQLNIMLPAETSALFSELDNQCTSLRGAESVNSLYSDLVMIHRFNRNDEAEIGKSLESILLNKNSAEG